MKNLFRGAFGLASNSVPETKTARQPLVALQLESKARWTARDYGALAREGFQKNAIVYRCVRMISEGAASVPFCVRRHQSCEAGDPAARFLSRGNPMGTATEVLESFYGFLQVGGNAYFEAALVDGVPSALYALRPDRVSVVTGRDGWPRGYDYEAGGYKRRFKRDMATGRSAVHHMRLFHPASDGYGFSPLEAAAQAVDVHNEGGRWAKALLDNSARPSGALIYRGGEGMERLSDEAFDRLKSELEGQHSGARHAGRPMQGYRIDRPMTGRAALTPLSLTYGFNAIETAKGLRFASIGTEANLRLTADDIIGDLSASIEHIKATSEDRLRDVRIHFIDAGNDYQLGLASARDRAAETVRVLDINAPIVMDKSFARLTVDRVLERQIQSDVLLNFQLSETRLDIEVGDLISLPENDELWQVETMEGLTAQRVQVRRVGELSALPNTGSTPEVSAAPQWAAKPFLFGIDVPGDYSGPLVGVGLDPFVAAEVRGPQDSVSLGSPAIIGALLSDLPIGPIGRWDVVNSVDVFFPEAFLSSLSDADVYEGGNRFALETATGWEIFQAAQAELIAPSTYRLSRLLRGQDGSDADMQDVIASGARLIWLGAGWKDLPISDSLIGESVPLSAIAAGRQSDVLEHNYKAAHLRPLSPVHVKITEQNGKTQISWIRRTRLGGDSWAGLDVPLGEEEERYRVLLWVEGVVVAEHETTVPMLTLPNLENVESVSVTQASRAYGWGAAVTLTL